MPTLPVTRSQVRLLMDPHRLIAKPYIPEEDGGGGNVRVDRLVHRVLALPPADPHDANTEKRDQSTTPHTSSLVGM